MNRAGWLRQGAARIPLRVDVLAVAVAGADGGHRLRAQAEVDVQELVVEALARVPPAPEEEEEE